MTLIQIADKITELRAEETNLQHLQKHPGWKYFEKMMQAVSMTARNQIFSMEVNSFDTMIRMGSLQAYNSGVLAFKLLLETRMLDITEDIRNLTTEQEELKNG